MHFARRALRPVRRPADRWRACGRGRRAWHRLSITIQSGLLQLFSADSERLRSGAIARQIQCH